MDGELATPDWRVIDAGIQKGGSTADLEVGSCKWSFPQSHDKYVAIAKLPILML